jgi:hypothetical protein
MQATRHLFRAHVCFFTPWKTVSWNLKRFHNLTNSISFFSKIKQNVLVGLHLICGASMGIELLPSLEQWFLLFGSQHVSSHTGHHEEVLKNTHVGGLHKLQHAINVAPCNPSTDVYSLKTTWWWPTRADTCCEFKNKNQLFVWRKQVYF